MCQCVGRGNFGGETSINESKEAERVVLPAGTFRLMGLQNFSDELLACGGGARLWKSRERSMRF